MAYGAAPSYQTKPIPYKQLVSALFGIIGNMLMVARWCEDELDEDENAIEGFDSPHTPILNHSTLWREYFDFGADANGTIKAMLANTMAHFREDIEADVPIDKPAYYLAGIKGLVEIFRINPDYGVLEGEGNLPSKEDITHTVFSRIIREYEASSTPHTRRTWFPAPLVPRFPGDIRTAEQESSEVLKEERGEATKAVTWADHRGEPLGESRGSTRYPAEEAEEESAPSDQRQAVIWRKVYEDHAAEEQAINERAKEDRMAQYRAAAEENPHWKELTAAYRAFEDGLAAEVAEETSRPETRRPSPSSCCCLPCFNTTAQEASSPRRVFPSASHDPK